MLNTLITISPQMRRLAVSAISYCHGCREDWRKQDQSLRRGSLTAGESGVVTDMGSVTLLGRVMQTMLSINAII